MIFVVKAEDRYYLATNGYFANPNRSLDFADLLLEENLNMLHTDNGNLIGLGWKDLHIDIIKANKEIFDIDVTPIKIKESLKKLCKVEEDYQLSYLKDDDAADMIIAKGMTAYHITNNKICFKINDVDIISGDFNSCLELKVIYLSLDTLDVFERIKEAFVKYCSFRKIPPFPLVIYNSLDNDVIRIND